MKRSYRYRILSPVICLLSLSYLARQKYTLSPTARVCLNVESLQIVLLFHFVVLHSDRLLLLLLFCCCAAPPRVTGRDLLLCFAAVRGAEGELLLIPSELNFMQAKHNRRSEHEPPASLTPPLPSPRSRCQMFLPMFSVRRICSECVQKGKGICTHTLTRTRMHTAASQKYTGLPDNEGGQGGIITSHHNNIILLTTPAASSMTV